MSNVISLLVILLSDVSGPVFGSRDYFTGLAVFFDTYSNENGDHAVSMDRCL